MLRLARLWPFATYTAPPTRAVPLPFPRLPLELNLLIFDQLARRYGDDDEYHERQDALRSCCLVSRGARQLAQPLLWQVARLGNPGELRAFAVAVGHHPAFRRAVRVIEAYCFDFYDALTVARQYPELQVLRFSGAAGSGIVLLDEVVHMLPNLRHLAIDVVEIAGPEIPCDCNFASLRSLSLGALDITLDALNFLLSPATTPFLAAVRLGGLSDRGAAFRWQPLNLAGCQHLNRLDYLHLGTESDPDSRGQLPSLVTFLPRALSIPVLYDIDLLERENTSFSSILPGLDTLQAHHLQLTAKNELGVPDHDGDSERYSASRAVDGLAQLTAWIASTSTIRTLSLPCAHHPSREESDEMRSGFEALLGACERRRVAVSWRWGYTREEDERINHEFWQYARELKAGRCSLT
ncbi:hypothetical protein JCM8097_008032 [Rhodosporidiobolus ruineniae]